MVHMNPTTLQYLDEEMELRKHTIQFSEYQKRHTGDNIATLATEALERVGLKKANVTGYVTDNASNMKASARTLGVKNILL